MKRENKNPNKPRCPNCESYSVLYTKSKKAFWCRTCGQEWKKVIKKEEMKNEAT